MKHIKDLTEQDCIHCKTQEEWDGIWQIIPNPHGFLSSGFSDLVVIFTDGLVADKGWAELRGYTIHPASDFLTPQVSVLTEIGDTKVIRHNDGCIVIKDDKAMTLTKDIVNWIKENL